MGVTTFVTTLLSCYLHFDRIWQLNWLISQCRQHSYVPLTEQWGFRLKKHPMKNFKRPYINVCITLYYCGIPPCEVKNHVINILEGEWMVNAPPLHTFVLQNRNIDNVDYHDTYTHNTLHLVDGKWSTLLRKVWCFFNLLLKEMSLDTKHRHYYM